MQESLKTWYPPIVHGKTFRIIIWQQVISYEVFMIRAPDGVISPYFLEIGVFHFFIVIIIIYK
jgi:hypothetical protein